MCHFFCILQPITIKNIKSMPRLSRKASDSGVYHVMLRGNNKQDIFEYQNDYLKFQEILYQKSHPQYYNRDPLEPCCVIYAYCLMPNHVHLLIREREESISECIKSIAESYAQYYNLRYGHTGHLYQSRFRSEPVNDWEYFLTLIRYIHQNPVAGGLALRVKDYKWSSWSEYDHYTSCPMPFCSVSSVLSRISLEALIELVDEPLAKASKILDYNNETKIRLSEDKIREFINKDCGFDNPKNIQSLPNPERRAVLKKILAFGGSIRQISRLTGINESFVRRAR